MGDKFIEFTDFVFVSDRSKRERLGPRPDFRWRYSSRIKLVLELLQQIHPTQRTKHDIRFRKDGQVLDGRHLRGWLRLARQIGSATTPAVNGSSGQIRARACRFERSSRCRRKRFDGMVRRDIHLEEFLCDHAAGSKVVREIKVWRERRFLHRGNHAVLKAVAGSEAEDAYGFHANVLISGCVDDGGIGIVGDGAGENVDGAAGGVRDACKWNFNLLKKTVVVEIEPRKLARAKLAVNFHTCMNFFAG